jgi:membrane protease YdiL (CAAX protease family)
MKINMAEMKSHAHQQEVGRKSEQERPVPGTEHDRIAARQPKIHVVWPHTFQQIKQKGQCLKAGQSVAPFFLFAFLFSWLIEVPLALQAQGIVDLSLPFGLHYLAGYGPMVAALILTFISGGWPALRNLLGKIVKWRVPVQWWIVAFSPLLIYLLLILVLTWLRQQPPSFNQLGNIKFLPDLGFAALLFWIVTFGIGEETGWRGYALPRLLQRHSPLKATIIIWFWWALWHLPLFYYTYDQAALFGFLPGLFAAAIIFTWLYNKASSILIVAVWHGTFNLTTACVACGEELSAAVVSTAVMVGALFLLILYKPFLTRQSKMQHHIENK